MIELDVAHRLIFVDSEPTTNIYGKTILCCLSLSEIDTADFSKIREILHLKMKKEF